MASTLVKHSKRTVRNGCKRCGSTDLYWAHDTTRPAGKPCKQCDVDGRWILVDRDLKPHTSTCPKAVRGEPSDESGPDGVDAKADDAAPAVVPAVPAVPAPAPAPPAAGVDAALAAFQTLMASMAPQLDKAQVTAMIREELGSIVYPTRTVVQRTDGTLKPIDGATHRKVADVLTDLMAGEHVMMVGPAGTGKSTIAEQCAEALGIPFYGISCSPMMPASQLLGYMQAEGDYVRSLYREAYEHGGLFHFDEIDNSHPSVLAVINQSLANGCMAFPDGMVKRHADFKCVASANTYGKGADRAYVGRQAIDAATLDRFTIETIEIDEALEHALCMGAIGKMEDGAEVVAQVLRVVRKYRANAEAKRMTVVLSPRASVGMCRLLAAGKTWEDAMEARIRRGMSDADWSKLTA